MNNEHEMVLQDLFTAADTKLEDGVFTQKVIRQTYKVFLWLGLMAAGMVLVFLLSLLVLGLSPLDVVQGLTAAISTPVFTVGNEWAAWALAPVNNIGGVLVLGFKGFRIVQKKVLRGNAFS